MNKKIHKNMLPAHFTMGLALFDAVPVLFFGIAAILLGYLVQSALVIVGAFLCFAAGALKVLWKVIVVCKKKNIWGLFVQMRIVMPAGFIMMILGLVLCWNDPAVADIRLMAFEIPVLGFLIFALLCCILMGIFAIAPDNGQLRSDWIEEIINAVGQLAFLIAMLLLTYASGYYHADDTAKQALITSDTVQVEINEDMASFIPKEKTDTGLIFYPGGNVEYTAYAPLMHQLAEKGICCIVVRMPLNLAFLDVKAADRVMTMYPDISHWLLGGHSLGGVGASFYAAEYPEKIEGLILLAAYSTKSLENTSVLSLYGTEDRIVDQEAYNENKPNLPEDLNEVIIQGGNHCQFGSYGFQEGDGKALITSQEQWGQTCEAVLYFLQQ